MKKFIKLVAGAVTFGVLSSAVFQGANYFADQYGEVRQESARTETKKGNYPIAALSADAGNEIAGVSDVAEAVLPSIVAIDVKVVSQQRDFFGRVYESQGQGSGSGIIFKEDSDYIYIVTNNHVVEDSVEVVITFNDKTTADAVVTGTDADMDLAVVKVAKQDMKEGAIDKIKVAVMADSSQIKVGEQAIAVGNALGYGTSVTVGYVSAKDREISDTMKVIQTDAAINPGNSGGALVNAKGQVIGINSSKLAAEEVEGIGFAIPISDAAATMEKLAAGDSHV